MTSGKKKILKIVSAILGIIILFSIILAYYHYLTLKKAFIDRISSKAGSLIGQRVRIGDLSFSSSGAIDIHDITIENPEGFGEGQLLRVKKVSLHMKLSELPGGRVSFYAVEIDKPELSLIRDKQNKFNISDTFMLFLSKKVTTRYRIDTVKVNSGTIDINRDQRYRISNIILTLSNLSSDTGDKTLITGGVFSGKNRISIDGWVFLNDDPEKFSLSASSDNIEFSLFKELIGKDIIDTKRARLDIGFQAEGDKKNGIALKSRIHLKNAGSFTYKKDIKDITLNADAFLDISGGRLIINNLLLNAGDASAAQLKGTVKNITLNPPYSAELKVIAPDLSALSGIASGFFKIPYRFTGSVNEASFKGTFDIEGSIHGRASVNAKSLSAAKTEDNRTAVKNAALNSDVLFRGRDLDFSIDTHAGNVSAKLSGKVDGFIGQDRSIKIRVVLPETRTTDIRNAFWDNFPDKLLYAGLNGSLSADISIGYGKNRLSAEGELRIKNLMLEGENGEYSAGPVNGIVPLHYKKPDNAGEPIHMPSFDPNEFENLSRYYADKKMEDGFARIKVGSLRYGFRLLEDAEVWVSQMGSYLNISLFSANIFGGRLSGSAVLDISDGLNYRAGFLVKGISLTRLCEDISPIKGYITGKVDGIAALKGSGAGLDGLIGRADFRAYRAGGEKTKISREFLEKVGGPSMKAYLRDRDFDKGVLSLYIQDGFLIFRELEISNRNFLGVNDLSVKVAPFNNRIAVEHLMSTIEEAAQRAKEK